MQKYETGMMGAFARAAAKPEGTSANDFIDAILEERPDLQGEMVYVPKQGCFGHTVFIGDEVFKGPCYGAQTKNFDREPNILQELEGKGLPVPRVTYRGKKTVFYGMTRIRGTTLERLEKKMSKAELKDLAEEVTDFMIDMALKLPRENGLYALQGDLRAPNILIDRVTKKLVGIIDFGMACDVTKEGFVPRHVWSNEFKELLMQALQPKMGKLPDGSRDMPPKENMAAKTC